MRLGGHRVSGCEWGCWLGVDMFVKVIFDCLLMLLYVIICIVFHLQIKVNRYIYMKGKNNYTKRHIKFSFYLRKNRLKILSCIRLGNFPAAAEFQYNIKTCVSIMISLTRSRFGKISRGDTRVTEPRQEPGCGVYLLPPTSRGSSK